MGATAQELIHSRSQARHRLDVAEGRVKSTGCNRGCLISKVRGLKLVLDYLRIYYQRKNRLPLYIRVSDVANCFGLRGDRKTETNIGKGLSFLAENGYLERWSNGRNKTYLVLDKLHDHFREYPCLKGCITDSSICSLLGTFQCPFLQGVIDIGPRSRPRKRKR